MLYYNSNIIFIYAKGNITCKSTVMLMNALAILRGTFGNFRPLSLTTSGCVSLYRDLLVNTIMLMSILAILRGTFCNFPPLSLTTSARVNLHYKLTTDYFERAL